MKTKQHFLSLIGTAVLCCSILSSCIHMAHPYANIAGYVCSLQEYCSFPLELQNQYKDYTNLYKETNISLIVTEWTDKGPSGTFQRSTYNWYGYQWEISSDGDDAVPVTHTLVNDGTKFAAPSCPYLTDSFGWKVISATKEDFIIVSDSRKWYAAFKNLGWKEAAAGKTETHEDDWGLPMVYEK